MNPSRVVLVEGESDRIAVLTLATRLGHDLTAGRVEVLAMGGITNARAFALRYGPLGRDIPLAGLYDVADEPKLRRGLKEAGVSMAAGSQDLGELGFYRCSADLEDELIRALGIPAVEAAIERAGEARSLQLLAGMPAQRQWTREAVLHRFLGVRSGRKARYAELLVQALPPDRAPRPLRDLLTWVQLS